MPLKAGDEIDAYCTKCKLDLNHKIVAIAKDVVQKVLCLTCGSEHKYRKPKAASATKKKARASSSAAGKARSAAARAALEQYEQRVVNQPDAAFTRYKIGVDLQEFELVVHKKFGKGFVQELLDSDKVQVMFSDGPRTLVHRRS